MTFADFYWDDDFYALSSVEDILALLPAEFHIDGQPSVMNVSGATTGGSFQLDGQANRFEIDVGLNSEVGQFNFGKNRPDFEASLTVQYLQSMATRREQILSNIRTALNGTDGVGSRIYRSRVEPIARAESPAIIVEPVNDVVAQSTSLPTLDHTLTVRVVVIVRGDVPDQLADPIIEDLHRRIMSDLTVGGLAIDVQPSTTDFSIESGDAAIGVVFCLFRVMYRTTVGDLSIGA